MQAIFKKLGIYVHVPFCAKACAYCRFYKRVPTPLDIRAYLAAMRAEIDLTRVEAESSGPSGDCGGFLQDCDPVLNRRPAPVRADTVFFGGGTPTVLSESQLEELARMLAPFGAPSEWTVEAAPTGLTPGKLKLLKSLGVTRISLGVQSFSEKTLAALGRSHAPSAARRAIEIIADAGFEHFGIDMIFGAKGQSRREWEDDLDIAASQPVDHISAYCLEFESATSACAGRASGRSGDLPSRKREGELYEIAMDRLESLGFSQYEISNYSKPGGRCLHNLCTWNMAAWIGLGPSAASQWRAERRRNPVSLEAWADGIGKGAPVREDVVRLTAQMLFADSIIFGLRMSDGVNISELSRRFPEIDASPYLDTAEKLRREGLLEARDGSIKLTRRGKLLADAVAVEFL